MWRELIGHIVNGVGRAVCVAVVLAGCAGDDRAAADALFPQLLAVEASPLADVDAAECVARAVVSTLEMDPSVPLHDVVFGDEELVVIGQAATSCAETERVVIEVLGGVYASEDASCIAEHVSDTFSNRTIGAVVVGADPIAYEGFFEAVADTAASCPTVDN